MVNNKDRPVPGELIEYSKAMFDRNAADFDTLDKKALGVIGIVGLIVGFQALNMNNLIDLGQDISEQSSWGFLWIIMVALFIHGISLLVSIWKSLAAFQVKEIDYPAAVDKLVETYLEGGDDGQASEKIRMDIVNSYKEAGLDLEKLNSNKARKLKCSVQAIFVSILSLIVFLGLLTVYRCSD